jgi:hypothetical protein
MTDARPQTSAKKAILDDDGCIIGVGDTEPEARADALRTIELYPTDYLRDLVAEMMVRDVSAALAAQVIRDGGDVPTAEVNTGGKRLLVTPEEAASSKTGGRS